MEIHSNFKYLIKYRNLLTCISLFLNFDDITGKV